jgi:Tol biopolymer transport system component
MLFDLERLELRGQPWLVEPEVATFSASGTTVAFLPRVTAKSRLKWLGADGTPGEVLGEPTPSNPFPALSPDGSRVAIVQQVENEWGLWVHDLARGTRTRLPGNARGDAAWHPDGRTVIYSALVENRQTLHRARIDSSSIEPLEPGQRPFTADGRYLFFDRFERSDGNLYVRDLTAGAPAVPFLAGPTLDMAAVPSADGRLVAYVSMPSLTGGNPEIMLRRFPRSDERWQVSASGGWWPRWSRDGKRIFYVTSEAMYEVAVRASADGVELSRPRRLFAHPVAPDAHGPEGFDVAADGRFLVMQREPVPRERTATVVLNWSPPRAGS